MKRTVLAAGAALLLLGLAAAAPAYGAEPVSPAAVRATTPDPHAPVRGVVPGLTGADARQAAGAAGERFAQLRENMTGDGISIQQDLHAAWGAFPRIAAVGGMATQVVNPALRVSVPDETLYTPTLLPGKTACFEMTTFYFAGVVKLGAWNWCAASPGFDKTVTIDSAFLATYGTTVAGRPAYSALAQLTDAATNTWTGYLWNYTTSGWDVFYTSSGTTKLSGNDTGWNMWEIYTNTDPTSGNGYYCADSRGVTWESFDIRWAFTKDVWEAASSTNTAMNPASPSPASYHCPTLTFTLLTANSRFRIENLAAPSGALKLANGKCVDVNAAGTADGTRVQVWTCNGLAQQTWTLPGDQTLRAFGKCLDVTSSGLTNGTKVQLWGCNGTGAQRWVYDATTRSLRNPQSNKCLESPANTTTNGTQLQIWTCNGLAQQQFTVPQ